MSGLSCIYRRTSGIYVVRLVVPARLRPAIGRSEVHVSTGLRELNAAIRTYDIKMLQSL
jgi:hypothetical protein